MPWNVKMLLLWIVIMNCVLVTFTANVNTKYNSATLLALRQPQDSPLPTQLLSNLKYLGELQGNSDVYEGLKTNREKTP